jgi:hypothetical protein
MISLLFAPNRGKITSVKISGEILPISGISALGAFFDVCFFCSFKECSFG